MGESIPPRVRGFLQGDRNKEGDEISIQPTIDWGCKAGESIHHRGY
jgi:hypothetical protein